MLLREFFNTTPVRSEVGPENMDTDRYAPKKDSSVMFRKDTRKTRLTLRQINQLRKSSEQHILEQERDLAFIQDMYKAPPPQM